MALTLGDLSSSSWQQARTWMEEHKIRGVIFDFDRTLIPFHTGGCMEPKELIAKLKRETPTDFMAMNQWLYCYFPNMKRGVASFADLRHAPAKLDKFSGPVYLAGKLMIQKTLHTLLGEDAKVYQILANDPKFSPGREVNKNWHLDIFSTVWQLPPSAMLLIDDDKRNIDAASHQGYQTWHVEGKQGFKITQIFPSSSPSIVVSPPPTIIKGAFDTHIFIPSLPLASLSKVSLNNPESKIPKRLAPVPLAYYDPLPPMPRTPLLKPITPLKKHERSKTILSHPLSTLLPNEFRMNSNCSTNKD